MKEAAMAETALAKESKPEATTKTGASDETLFPQGGERVNVDTPEAAKRVSERLIKTERDYRVAIAQITTDPGSIAANTEKIIHYIDEAKRKAAKDAGAEFVGMKDLIQKCQEGFQDFDVAIATPGAMAEVRKLGKVLGPRGLMPNPRTGTVTEDTAKAVQEVKAGRIEFKLDKNGNVAVPVGKFSFEENALVENANAVIEAVVRARPPTAKGRYLEGVTISATMSPGVRIDPSPYLTGV